jgi:hypothetical protein
MGKESSKSKESFETSLRACNVCGDIGHTSKDHKDQCPNCDESHPVDECLTSLVTCFLCEGNNHVPVQCHLYPVIQQMKQQVRDGFCQPLGKTHGNIGPKIRIEAGFKTTKCCYKCEEEGHLARDCYMKRPRDNEIVIEYDEQELEDLLALERPKKKKNRQNPKEKDTKTKTNKRKIPRNIVKKDISLVECYKCHLMGHYADKCPEKVENKPRRDISLVKCYKCRQMGHYADKCPERQYQSAK